MSELDVKIEGVESIKEFIKTKPHVCDCDGNCGENCKCKEKLNDEKRKTDNCCSYKR